MSALTTDTSVFGAPCSSDPGVFCPSMAFRREIDFSKIPGGAVVGTNYEFIPVPKGFYVTACSVEEVESCDASAGVALQTKSAGTNLLGAGAIVGGDSKLFNVAIVNKAFPDDDMLCLSLSTNGLKSGKVGFSIVGFFTSEESLATAKCPTAWRVPLQTQDNVSGGQIDPRDYNGYVGS